MGMAGRQVRKKGSGGRHGAANTGVGKRSVKGKASNPAAGKVGRKDSTGGGPGGGF